MTGKSKSTTIGLLNLFPPACGQLVAAIAQLTTHVSFLPNRQHSALVSHLAVTSGLPPTPRVPKPGRAVAVESAKCSQTQFWPRRSAGEPCLSGEPSLSRGRLPPRAVRSTRDNLLLPFAAPGSSHLSTPSSAYGAPEVPRTSHRTRSAPRPSCTCPQMASLGRTRQRERRSSSQPMARRLEMASSQCVYGGVWVTTMSVSRGMPCHRSDATGNFGRRRLPLPTSTSSAGCSGAILL